MHWDASPNAGFCPGSIKPWMRVHPAIDFRSKQKDVFVYGDFELLDSAHKDVVAYQRISEWGERWVVVLNFSGNGIEWQGLGDLEVKEWVLGNYKGGVKEKALARMIELRPWEGLIGVCKP
jgi:glycosidase